MAFSEVCRIYQQDEKFLVLNPSVPAWVVTNINGVLLLKLYAEEKTFAEIAAEFQTYAPDFPVAAMINFLEEAAAEHLFDAPTELTEYAPSDLRNVYLNITDACNLNCVYCVNSLRDESKQNLGIEDYKRIVDEIAALNPKIGVIFTGGEALTSGVTIPAAAYAKTRGLDCMLMTNATLIDEKNIGVIAENFSHVQISLDGSRAAVHDYFRGNGNFAKTERAITLLKNHGVEIQLMMVVSKKNLDDVAAMIDKWGSEVDFQPLFPFANPKLYDALKISGKDYFDAMTRASDNVIFHEFLAKIPEHYRTKKTQIKCGLGDGQISISHSGDVYPCALLHNPLFKVGNIRESSLAEIYNSPALRKFKIHTADNISKCRGCDFKLICGGSCQARNFIENGDLDIAGDFCEYERLTIVRELINLSTLKEL